MNRKLPHLIVLAAVTILMWIALVRVESPTLRALLGVPYVLVLPGYALTLALLPGEELELAERVVFSLGLSLAMAALGTIVLHVTPWGLTTESWTGLLGAVTLSACAVAVVQRTPRRRAGAGRLHLGLNADQGLLLGLAAAVTFGAFAVSYANDAANERRPYTSLWVLPASAASFQLGIENNEGAPVAYRLLVEVSGTALVDNLRIELDDGESWRRELSLTAALTGDVKVWLYQLYVPPEECLGDAPPAACLRNDQIYRQVVLKSLSRTD